MFQNRLAKLEGQHNEKAARVNAAQSKAIDVFGTDDPNILNSLAEDLSNIEAKIEAEKASGKELLSKLVPKLEAGEILSALEIKEAEEIAQRITEMEAHLKKVLCRHKNNTGNEYKPTVLSNTVSEEGHEGARSASQSDSRKAVTEDFLMVGRF